MKNIFFICFFLAVFSLNSQSNIIINDNVTSGLQPANDLETLLETYTGANVDIVTLSPTNIAASDQVWILIPNSDYSADIVNALKQGLEAGKRIVLVGEYGTFSDAFGGINNRLNALATEMGMSSSFASTNLLSTGNQTCEAEVLIQENVLTEGVTSPIPIFASTSEILMGDNSFSLIKFEDDQSTIHDISIVECISNGDVVMLGDVNLWCCSGCPDNSYSSVRTFFNNIVNTPASCSSAPIPTLSQWGVIALSMLIMIFGLVTLKYSTRFRLQGT